MLVLEMFRIAAYSIGANILRSVLTMLGIVIGIAAVITMVALGNGARQAIAEQLEQLGGDIISVRAGQGFFHGVARAENRLTIDDALALARDMPGVQAVVPELHVRKQVKFGNENRNLRLIGTTPDFIDAYQADIALGKGFSGRDNAQKRRVVILGGALPAELEVEPSLLLGQALTIDGASFEIVGILEEKGSVGFSNRDEDLFVPLQTAQYRIAGSDRVDSISVEMAPGTQVDAAMMDIERILRREHRLRPGVRNTFTISDSKQFLVMQQETANIFSALLASVATISLVVGGIGIMNIMLVTVTERTREIGVRKALGATRLNILIQFLIEATCLCILGGLLGIAVGVGASSLLAELAGWATLVSADAVALAFGFSVAIGLFFGLWPAYKAARLDPIQALQYE